RSSPSSKSHPRRPASSPATVDFPQPETPINTNTGGCPGDALTMDAVLAFIGDSAALPPVSPPAPNASPTRRYTCEPRPTATMSASSPRRSGALGYHSDRVYVHAKVGIVDDRWLTLGSANLNAHSFFNDTELNVVTCDAALARDTRLRLWAAHLEREIDEIAGDPSTVIDDLWRTIASEQRERRTRGEPVTHRLVELQATSRRSERLLGRLQALLVDG